MPHSARPDFQESGIEEELSALPAEKPPHFRRSSEKPERVHRFSPHRCSRRPVYGPRPCHQTDLATTQGSQRVPIMIDPEQIEPDPSHPALEMSTSQCEVKCSLFVLSCYPAPTRPRRSARYSGTRGKSAYRTATRRMGETCVGSVRRIREIDRVAGHRRRDPLIAWVRGWRNEQYRIRCAG
jgi:hypothetical protein